MEYVYDLYIVDYKSEFRKFIIKKNEILYLINCIHKNKKKKLKELVVIYFNFICRIILGLKPLFFGERFLIMAVMAIAWLIRS